VGIGVVPVVEVELGAIVPGCAPLGGVVLVGVVAAGTLDEAPEGDVSVGEVVGVEAVVPWTRAEAGIDIPSARSVLIVVSVAEAGAATKSRHKAMPKQRTRARAVGESRARTRGSPWSTTFISSMLTSHPTRKRARNSHCESRRAPKVR